MTSTLRLPAMALLLVLGALLATACGGSDTTTLTFTQDTPVLHDASDPEATVHYGGLSSYEAALRQDGNIVGELIGSRHTILEAADLAAWADRMHVPGHDKANPDEVLMLTMLVFELEAGTLIVEGQTLNTPAEHAQMLVGVPLMTFLCFSTFL